MDIIPKQLKSSFMIGLIALLIGLCIGYKSAPKPTHSIETKIEYQDKIVYQDRKVIVDRVITQYPDGTIITNETDRSLETDIIKDKSYSYSKVEKKVVDKNHQVFLQKWSDGDLGINYIYKLYSNDRFDIHINGGYKSNPHNLLNGQGVLGIGVGF